MKNLKKQLHYKAFQNGSITEETYDKICELVANHDKLKEILTVIDKEELLTDSKKIFNSFLKSKDADNLKNRMELVTYQEVIEQIFKILPNKPALE